MTLLDVVRGEPAKCEAKARCLQCHMMWEERHLFPRLRARGDGAQVETWLSQHERWRRMLARGEAPSSAELHQHAAAEERACTAHPDLVVELGELCADHERIENEAAGPP